MGELSGSISVVIPTYNRSALLSAAVRSALAQSLAPLEVLVCDDGSTDGSRDSVAGLGDGRVRWIDCGRHGRPAGPRNRGVREARGDWVAFLDDDDVWHAAKLERQAAFLDRGFEAVSSNARRMDAQGRDQGPFFEALPPSAGLRDLLACNWVVTSAALVRRSLLLDCGGFPESGALRAVEDYALWLRVADRTRWALLAEPLLDYRDAPAESIRQDSPGRHWRTRRRVMGDLLRWSLGPGSSPSTAARAAKAWLGAAAREAAGRA
jgi:glycosyltransferase involved in cell wall biosynthesis